MAFDPAHLLEDRFGPSVSALSRDIDSMTRAFRRLSRDTAREGGHVAHHAADEALHQGGMVAKALGRRALRSGKAVGRDPAPAIAGVIAVASLLSLVLSRRRS